MASAGRRSAKDRALDLLGYRSRSREELRRRLTQAGFEETEIEAALADLEQVGLVDDAKFARELAAYQTGKKGAGRRLALNALRRAGVATGVAEEALAEVSPGDESERAEEVARARASRLGAVDPATVYRRLLSHLLRRGFEGDTARGAARRALEGRAGSLEDPN